MSGIDDAVFLTDEEAAALNDAPVLVVVPREPVDYGEAGVTIHVGDCLDVLRGMPAESVHAIVTDPPYGLEFMGKEWDRFDGRDASKTQTDTWGKATTAIPGSAYASTLPRFTGKQGASLLPFQKWCEQWATECLRVLKPGGHLLAFGGTRTWHRLACAVEDAGFEMRDSIAWLYGSGFPKSLDVSKAIDKAAGATREIVGDNPNHRPVSGVQYVGTYSGGNTGSATVTAPATAAARQWQGWGTALKPAFEPIVVARKPLTGTVAANVLAHGTGALNIDACRVDTQGETWAGNAANAHTNYTGKVFGEFAQQYAKPSNPAGRWPANVVLDGDAADDLDRQSGTLTSGVMRAGTRPKGERTTYGQDAAAGYATAKDTPADASRFFPTFRYQAKAPTSERPRGEDGTAHPTVKPLALMRWLVRLVAAPGQIVLDPFAGSGTTAEACILEGMRSIIIEREAEYVPLIEQRIARVAR